jgi:hypothetical protein
MFQSARVQKVYPLETRIGEYDTLVFQPIRINSLLDYRSYTPRVRMFSWLSANLLNA